MALQFNKISRSLFQGQRFLCNNKVEALSVGKDYHGEHAAVHKPPAPEADAKFVENLSSLLVASGLKSPFGNLLKDVHTRNYSSHDCPPQKKRRKCRPPKPGKCKLAKCPKFFLQGCECPTKTSCHRLDVKYPCCEKTPAPYPAYSEACVEELDTDPSECVQCPWKHCPDFKPQKKSFHMGVGVLDIPVPPTTFPIGCPPEKILNEMSLLKKKPPCPKPPSPCEKRRRLIEEQKKQKDDEDCERQMEKTNKRKCAEAETSPLVEPPTVLELAKNYKKDESCGVRDYDVFEYDPRQADYEHKRKRCPLKRCPYPLCPPKRKNRSTNIRDCPPKCPGRCVMPPNPKQQIIYELCSCNKKCPPRERKDPKVDYTLNCPCPLRRYRKRKTKKKRKPCRQREFPLPPRDYPPKYCPRVDCPMPCKEKKRRKRPRTPEPGRPNILKRKKSKIVPMCDHDD